MRTIFATSASAASCSVGSSTRPNPSKPTRTRPPISQMRSVGLPPGITVNYTTTLRESLLLCHQHVDDVFGVDHVAVIGLARGEPNPADLAVEDGVGGGGAWQYGGAELVANPRCLVWAEPDGCGGRERALAGLLAVVVEGDGSTLGQPPSLVGKLCPDLVLAGRKRLPGVDHGHVDADEVVDKPRRALVHHQSPATEATALGENRPIRPALGHDQLRRDPKRLVLDVQDARLGEALHPREQGLLVARDVIRPAGELGVDPLIVAVIEGQDVVLGGLDQPQALQLAQLLGHLPAEVVRL